MSASPYSMRRKVRLRRFRGSHRVEHASRKRGDLPPSGKWTLIRRAARYLSNYAYDLGANRRYVVDLGHQERGIRRRGD